MIVNETMARTLWPGANAVDRTAVTGGIDLRVVGVVGDVRHSSLEEEAGLEMYLPIFQWDASSADLAIRTRLSRPALAASIRRAVRPLDPTMPLSDLRPLERLIDRAVSPRRFFASLMTVFAAVALALAALGIYGVIAYSVGQRTHEIGIRMALGATTGSVLLGVLSRTLGLALAGVLIGTAGAVAVSRVMSSLLFGISTFDPLTFGAMAAALTLAAILAGYLPARRAARLNPLMALRAGQDLGLRNGLPSETSPPVPLSLTGEGGRRRRNLAQTVGAGLVPARSDSGRGQAPPLQKAFSVTSPLARQGEGARG